MKRSSSSVREESGALLKGIEFSPDSPLLQALKVEHASGPSGGLHCPLPLAMRRPWRALAAM